VETFGDPQACQASRGVCQPAPESAPLAALRRSFSRALERRYITVPAGMPRTAQSLCSLVLRLRPARVPRAGRWAELLLFAHGIAVAAAVFTTAGIGDTALVTRGRNGDSQVDGARAQETRLHRSGVCSSAIRTQASLARPVHLCRVAAGLMPSNSTSRGAKTCQPVSV
jgi:hypothetical protein